MKIIFLDIDGVLNSHQWIRANEHLLKTQQLSMHVDLDKEAVARLERLVKQTEAKIVISSTWRIVHSLSSLRDILGRHGFTGEVIDKTPKLNIARGLEIQQWLDKNPVESFVILDDSSDMAHLLNKLVRTSFDDGLQDKHVEAAIELLSATPS